MYIIEFAITLVVVAALITFGAFFVSSVLALLLAVGIVFYLVRIEARTGALIYVCVLAVCLALRSL